MEVKQNTTERHPATVALNNGVDEQNNETSRAKHSFVIYSPFTAKQQDKKVMFNVLWAM